MACLKTARNFKSSIYFKLDSIKLYSAIIVGLCHGVILPVSFPYVHFSKKYTNATDSLLYTLVYQEFQSTVHFKSMRLTR